MFALLTFHCFQSLPVLGTFVYFEMSRVPPDGFSFVGYKCTQFTLAKKLSWLQALLLLGTFVYFNMSRVPPNVSSFVGYRCTNKACLRVFSTRSALVRHKKHSSQKRTLCSNQANAEAVYEINDNRASSLQSSRIVTYPLSGNCPVFH